MVSHQNNTRAPGRSPAPALARNPHTGLNRGVGALVRLSARLNLADGGMKLLHPDFDTLRLLNVAGVESALPVASSAEADRLTWELERPERLIRKWTSRDAAAA